MATRKIVVEVDTSGIAWAGFWIMLGLMQLSTDQNCGLLGEIWRTLTNG